MMRSFYLLCLSFVFLSIGACSAQYKKGSSDQSTELQKLIDDHWGDTLARNPVFATSVGVRDYDERLGSLSVASMNNQANSAQEFLQQLNTIEPTLTNKNDQLNAQLLRHNLEQTVESAEFNGRLMLLTNRGGWHMSMARLPSRAPFFNLADYESYVSRLNDFPRMNDEGITTLRASIKAGYTQPCVPMEGYEGSIAAHIVDNVEDSVFMRPFSNMPDSISSSDQERLKQQAMLAVESQVIPAFKSFMDFYVDEYRPACRNASGLFGLTGAQEYYQHRVKRFTTTDLTPDEVHNIGLSEVTRIKQEMVEVKDAVGFKGSRLEFVEFLRSDPQFYPKTEEEHLRHAAYLSKKADGEMPKLFKRLPRMPYAVKAVPADIAEKTTTAYYEPPAGDGSRAGVYRVNVSKLDTRPSFEMEALTLHEAVPGHHFQIALAQELDALPEFRRYGGVTAFIEGWGLYSERLGLEIGFYEDPYSNFGRLSYEMWRACRLVVDTGLHAKGWTRQQAIDFMLENTALSKHNIESEVDRYITWPGQALAYKIGELKIRELRTKAETALGAQFDVRDFHDLVLGNGSIPLSVLESVVDQWVASQLKR